MGSYGEEIHEMTEMRALAMGQYGHNNQPCHHLLYLFALLGEPSSTYSAVRMVLERAYDPTFYWFVRWLMVLCLPLQLLRCLSLWTGGRVGSGPKGRKSCRLMAVSWTSLQKTPCCQ